MQRTIKSNKESVQASPGQVKWINYGGPFKMRDGRIIPSDGNFFASPGDVPTAFRDVIKPTDPLAITKEEPGVVVAPLVYNMKQRGDSLVFDILDGRGKKINDKDLTEAVAKELLDKLMAD